MCPNEIAAALEHLQSHYRDIEAHPEGANGYVFFAINRVTAVPVAIKFYFGAPGERRHDEPNLLAQIQSPNVIPIHDAQNISDDWAFFVTPRRAGGTLDALIQSRPSAHLAIDTASGICNGASAIHALSMIHRDLKPGNIVLNNLTPEIADFGSVRRLLDDEQDVPASGHSIVFRPPESFASGRYSVKGDAYQIGCVLFQLCGGHLSYEGTDYFSAKDRRDYQAVADDVDRSLFVDAVIRRRAEREELLDFNTLPPWINATAKRCIRDLTRADPDRRVGNCADIAASLTRMRAAVSDWLWQNQIAKLVRADRVIELRPIQDGQYEPMQSRGGAFRRIPGVANATLSILVNTVE